MATVRYYGRRLPEDHFEGRLGSLVRGLNRARLVAERLTEAAVAVHEAKVQSVPLKPVLRRLVDEGMAKPCEVKTRPPVFLAERSEPDDPDIEGTRFYQSRDYGARVGRAISLEQKRDEVRGTAPVREDKTLTLVSRSVPLTSRAQRYLKAPLVSEAFEEV